MNWDDTGDAIQQAVERASGTTVIWKGQNVDAPGAEYIAIALGDMSEIGVPYERVSQDLTRPRGEEMEIQVFSSLECTLELECFTASAVSSKNAAALSLLTRAVIGLWLPSIKAILQRQAISIYDASPVQWIPDVPSTNFRGRSVCTLSVYMRPPTVHEYVGYIERVRGTVTVHGTASGGSSGTSWPFDSNNA